MGPFTMTYINFVCEIEIMQQAKYYSTKACYILQTGILVTSAKTNLRSLGILFLLVPQKDSSHFIFRLQFNWTLLC